MRRRNIPRPRPRCGACIVLHAQCPPRCFFAPYFSHEEGAIDFSAIHRIFGVGNASFLLYQVSELQAYRAYLQDSLFAYYSSHPQLVPPFDPNPNWSSSPPTIPESTLPHPGETSSSQMPLSDDLDELGPVIFGHRRRP
ncbi:LOB domain-containing protein 18-like [Diospyros lotus]|uniref:LOB domain-containing protein 18-like n=1 Tax=Diospyros lotus TaxID=55363 RepID=UPI00224F5D35|nr:LOB domain-containing protein 18-like [Diospyros lotus]